MALRVLVVSVGPNRMLCQSLEADCGFEVAAIQPARVDLGGFGGLMDADREGSFPRLNPRAWPLRPYPYSLYLGPVSRFLHGFRPDVVYGIGEPSELGIAQIMAIAQRHCPQARRVLFSFENVTRAWCGFPKALRGIAERRTVRRTDLVAACTESAAAWWREHGVPPERIRVVYLPATAVLERQPAEELRARLLRGGEFLVGFVGRLTQEKGVDLLLEALARLPAGFRLAVAGSGPDGPSLHTLAQRLQVASRATFLGRVEHELMAEFLSACDCLVLPSRSTPVWREQFGLVLVEAMMCQTPPVGSDSGAIGEVIGDGGLVFPEGDIGALVARLQQLHREPSLRAELACRGRERALRLFTWGPYVQRVADSIRTAASLPPR
jgi:glycosyltransferase involved in cell wall biosynthesis